MASVVDPGAAAAAGSASAPPTPSTTPEMTPGRVAALNNRGGLLFFEDFDFRDKQEWMNRNWTYSYGIIALYFIAILLGKRVMRDRQALDLRTALTSWNVGLALFSIAATLRTVPELINILLQQNGFHSSVCFPW